MSKPWIVIPAAGESRRFKEAGFSTPKPFLVLEDPSGMQTEMLRHVLLSLPMPYDSRVIVGTTEPMGDLPHVVIPHTRGQADTVYQMVKTLPSADPVLVLDCDMLLRTEDITALLHLLTVYDMVTAVAETFDPNASRVDRVPFPTRFVEKQPISQWGMVSGRGFKKCGELAHALQTELATCAIRVALSQGHVISQQEPYLSSAMNLYNGTKYAHVITEYVDLGTPQRVEEAQWKII